MKRMQVLIDELEFERFVQAARSQGVSLAQWVRMSLREQFRKVPQSDAAKKLAVVRAAASHAFPAPDMDQMLDEIARQATQHELP